MVTVLVNDVAGASADSQLLPEGSKRPGRQSLGKREVASAFHVLIHDDDDVYYSKGRRPREDEEGEESYEKRRQWPGRGG